MNLKEASKKKEQLENDLEYYSQEKEISLSKVGLSGTTYDKLNVSGGKRNDKFASYMEHLEDNDKLTLIELDKKINSIQKQINNINKWIDNELKRLEEYRDIEQEIIFLREQKKPMTWEQIALKTHYSSRQCQRIYEKYKKRIDKKYQ